MTWHRHHGFRFQRRPQAWQPKSRVEELRARLVQVDAVADTCIARCTDPKDREEHERWRKSRKAEIEAEIREAKAKEMPTRCTAYDRKDGNRCLNKPLPGKSLCAEPHQFAAAKESA